MKTKIKTQLIAVAGIALVSIILYAFTLKMDKGGEWVVPDKYKTMKNPTKAGENLEVGKTLWAKHCKSCHGKDGLGDGPKAATLSTPIIDFSTEDFQKQSDGSLFYKTKFGKDDMPSFEKKITSDDDIWSLVNFMRTFKE